jgi:diguanylate cyclase (GGDEF)-like protein/PAS domain S-box-containing protein
LLRAAEAGDKIAGPVECRLTGANGKMHVVEWRVEPVELGTLRAALSLISDVTNIAGTRDVLAGAEARQREIFEALAEGVIVVDAGGVCVDANRAAAELLRLGEPELLMGAPAEAMPLVKELGEPVGWERHPVWRALWGETVVAESFGVRFGTRVRTMQVSARPVYALESNEPVGAVITFADVTDRIAAEAELAASEARFRNLAAMAPVGIFEADSDGALAFVNEAWRHITGLDVQQDASPAAEWLQAVHEEDRDRVVEVLNASLERREPTAADFRFVHDTRDFVSVHAVVRPVFTDDQSRSGWLGMIVDMTDEHRLRAQLRHSERRLRELVEHTPDVMIRARLQPFVFDFVSPSSGHLIGADPQELYRHQLAFLRRVDPADRRIVLRWLSGRCFDAPVRFRLHGGDWKVRHVEVRARSHHAEHEGLVLEAVLRDVTGDVAAHDELDALAHHDTLTGLLNRRGLREAIRVRVDDRASIGVLFCDLDGFKTVNDLHGHDAGDQVLAIVAARLAETVRGSDIVARLGGDEFVVVVSAADADGCAERVLASVDRPIVLRGDICVSVGVSIGISTHHHGRGDDRAESDVVDRWLTEADQAMYAAKRAGKRRYVRRR